MNVAKLYTGRRYGSLGAMHCFLHPHKLLCIVFALYLGAVLKAMRWNSSQSIILIHCIALHCKLNDRQL